MIPSVEELEKLKVVELRARLSKFGISTSGRKAELIEKLRSYYEEDEDAASQDPSMAPSGIPPTPAQMLQAEQGRQGVPPGHMSDMPPVPPPPPLPPQQFLAQEEMIEREKQRIFQQQQQLIQKRQEEQQRLEAEKMQKALQQQQMLAAEKMMEQGMGGPPPPPPGAPPGPPPPKLDEMMQEKVMQQQHMIEQQQTEQHIAESSNIPDSDARDDEELLRHQQLAIQEITKQSLPPNVPLPPPPPVPFPAQAPGVPPLSAPVPPPPPLLPPAPQPSNLPQASQSASMPPPLLQPVTSQAPPPSSIPQGMSLPVPPPPPPPGLLLASQPPTSEPPPPAPPVDRTPGGPPPVGPPPPGPLPVSMPQDDQRERPPLMNRGPPPLPFEGPRSRMQPPFDTRGPPRPFFGGNFRGGPPLPPFSGPPGPPPVSQPSFNSRPNFNMPPPGQQPFRERGPPPLMGNRGPPPPGSFDMRDRPPPRQPVEGRSGRRDGPAGGTSGPGPESQRRTPVSQSNESETKEPAPLEIKLPMALEKVLAYKEERAQEVGVTEEEAVGLPATTEEDSAPTEMESIVPEADEDEGYDEEEEEEEPESNKSKKERIERKQKLTKNQRRKLKKKRRKEAKRKDQEQKQNSEEAGQESTESIEEETAYPPGVEIEYVAEKLEITDPSMRQFAKIFEAFRLSEELKPLEKTEPKVEERAEKKREEKKDSGVDAEDSDEEDQQPESDVPKLSKKKLRKMNRLSVAELKQLVNRPDVVEMHDVTARDPKLLVYLKAYRNTVPVPRHWCFKRKYLQGKRGIVKPPFELPDFIKKTGIMEMRQALQEKEEQQTMKTKMRQRVRPKMGKIDIDYQKLHDAFFRWQTKPKLTMHGELYYEGKEFETKLKEKKPGELSDELRTALGMPTGENADKYPPPWLIAMQRYGPPPSYPHLKIPGLNSPIPEGCTFGYHAGGWGKPPVDELGKPLYGDVFGTNADDFQKEQEEEEIDRTTWGELESESEEESDEEESEEEEDEDGKEIDETGLITPAEGGLITPSGLSSIATGMETPEMIELRKQNIEDAMEQGGDTPALYTVLPEKKTAVGGAMMGSAHVYDIGAATAGKKTGGSGITEGVAVALDPSELDLDTAAMAAKYEEQVREQQSQLEKEDFSDMVAEHAAKQKNKRKKQSQDSGRQAKKYKEFKF